MKDLEEEYLWIEKIKKGDTDQFAHLYTKHYKTVYSLCYRFTNHAHDAEEQLQEIFIRALKKVELFKGNSRFSTWLHRLAVNHLINFKKGQRPQSSLELVSEAEGTRSTSDLKMALERAISKLPEGFKTVFILHDREGFKHEEIAEILECSPATSRSQLCRARLALRETLTKKGVI